MDPLSISASIAGLLTLTAAVTGGVTALIMAYKDANEDLITLSLELATLNQVIELLSTSLKGLGTRTIPLTADFEPLNMCRVTLKELNGILPRVEDRKKMGFESENPAQTGIQTKLSTREKFRWIRKSGQIQKFVERLQHHKSTILMYLSGCQIDVLKSGLLKQDFILDEMKRIEKDVLLIGEDRALSAMQAYFGQIHPYKSLKQASERRHNGTGLWFVQSDSYLKWKATDDGKLWIHGIAGAGKTVLAALAVSDSMVKSRQAMTGLDTESTEKNFHGTTAAVAYFFCDYKSLRTLDINIIVGSLLFQLAVQHPDATADLQSFHKKCEKEFGQITEVPLDHLCVKFTQLASCFQSISLIVDGLDECDGHHTKVTRCLAGLSGGVATLRTLFFSRDEPDIREPLVSADFCHQSVEADNDDVKTFVSAQIEERIREKTLSVKSNDLKLKIQERLTSGAKGMFRWVECQLEALCEFGHEEGIEDALDRLPSGLHNTYERILGRIQQSKDGMYVIRALKWICHAKEPLSLAALSEIIMLRHDTNYSKLPSSFDHHRLLRHCSSFVRNLDSGRTVELAHYSVKEYLQQIEADSIFEAFRIRETEDQVELGKFCLGYLLLKDYNFSSQASRTDHRDLQEKRPFRQFAVANWTYHALGPERKFRHPTLLSLGKQLFSPDRPLWFESLIHESYLAKIDSTTLQNATLSRVADKISSTRVIHWSSSFLLPEITEWLLEREPLSVHIVSQFGTPIHCAISRDLTINKGTVNVSALDQIISKLVENHANVNQSFRKRNREMLASLLSSLPTSSANLLLEAGLVCDQQCLAELTDYELPRKIFQAIRPRNVLESDQDLLRELQSKYQIGPKPSIIDQIQAPSNSVPFNGPIEQRLIFCVKTQDNDMALFILESPVEVNASDSNGLTALHYAALNSSLDVAKALLRNGALFSERDEKGQTPSHYVAKAGHGEILFPFFEDNTNYFLKDKLSRTPLHIAAYSGNQPFLDYFCKDEDNIKLLNPIDAEGLTPFLSAAKAGQLLVLQSLLKMLPSEAVRAVTNEGKNALHLACRSGSTSAVSMLLQNSFRPDETSANNSTALHEAMAINDWDLKSDVVEILIKNDVDSLAKNSEGNFPLHLLFGLEDSKRPLHDLESYPSLEDLIRRSSDCANIKNIHGQTALHVASASGALSMPKWLHVYLKHGHDLFGEDNQGQSSFYILLSKYIDSDIFKNTWLLFLSLPSTSYGKNKEAFVVILDQAVAYYSTYIPMRIQTCATRLLTLAMQKMMWEICLKLLCLIKDFSTDSFRIEEMPLYLACKSFCKEAVFDAILQKTPDLSMRDRDGWTPVHLAVASSNVYKVQKLIERDPLSIFYQSQNPKNYTPLLSTDLSTQSGEDIALYLIDMGANLNAKSARGRSVIHDACREGAIRVLRRCGSLAIRGAGTCSLASGKRIWQFIGCVHWAALGKQLKSLEYLLDHENMDVDEQSQIELMTPLHISAYMGDLTMCQHLKDRGADINKENAAGETPLLMAFYSEDVEVVRFFLTHGAILPVNIDLTVRMEVVTWANPELRAVLREVGNTSSGDQAFSLNDMLSDSDTTAIDSSLRSAKAVLRQALKCSIELGSLALCRKIIQRGFNINTPVDSCQKCTPLIFALRLKMFDIGNLLVDHGADVNAITCPAHDEAGFNAAHYAARNAMPDLLKHIFSQGYNHYLSPVHPLIIAIIMRSFACVQVALDAPETILNSQLPVVQDKIPVMDMPVKCDRDSWPWASCNYVKGGGPNHLSTALGIATLENNAEIVDLLLSRGADTDATDIKGRTPLHIAAEMGFFTTIDKLIRYGARQDLKEVDQDLVPFWSALVNGNMNSILLLFTPESVGARKSGDWTPLHRSVELKQEILVTKLLDAGVNVDVVSNSGLTALHLACGLVNIDNALSISTLLLSREASVNVRSFGGETPFIYATQRGHLELCKRLLEYGADPFATNTRLNSALTVATEYGHLELVKWLLFEFPSLENMRNLYGCKAIHYAMTSNSHLMHEYALQVSMELVLECHEDCGSLLNMACKFGRDVVVKNICQKLDRGTLGRLCATSSSMISPPIVTAVLVGKIECVAELLDAAADIEMRCEHWDTPFITACKYGRLEIMKLLRDRGAKTSYINNEGREISAVEACKGHTRALEWLEEELGTRA